MYFKEINKYFHVSNYCTLSVQYVHMSFHYYTLQTEEHSKHGAATN